VAENVGLLTQHIQGKIKLDENKPKLITMGSAGPGTSVYVPSNITEQINNGKPISILLNFRGVSGDPKLVGKNLGDPNAVVVTAEASGPREQNKGSKLLEEQFGGANKINAIVSSVIGQLQKKFPDKQVKRGKLIISGFSGGGSVVARAVAERNKIPGGIDGVIINDGLHAKIGSPTLDSIVDYAREAEKDPSKKFRIIHTAIKPSYTSTTQTSDYILQQLGLKREPIKDPELYKQYGFVPKTEAKAGGVQITQMFDDPKVPYFVDNRPGSLGDTHVQSLWKGNPYIFQGVLD
jgi:hypothetical protein